MIDEPIAWIQKSSIEGLTKAKTSHYKLHCGVIQRKNQQFCIPLYRHAKEWVGLTDEEIQECLKGLPTQTIDVYAKRIEAKLKKKNMI